MPGPVTQGEGGGCPQSAALAQAVVAAQAIEQHGGQRAQQDRGQPQKPLLIRPKRVGELERCEGQERVGGVEVLAPIPVDCLVFAQLDAGGQVESGQDVQSER